MLKQQKLPNKNRHYIVIKNISTRAKIYRKIFAFRKKLEKSANFRHLRQHTYQHKCQLRRVWSVVGRFLHPQLGMAQTYSAKEKNHSSFHGSRKSKNELHENSVRSHYCQIYQQKLRIAELLCYFLLVFT
jgi:hypothetical protein